MDEELQKKIVSQMEFYFNDSNLEKDRFMKQKIQEDPEGYMDLEIFASFNRIKNLTTDMAVLVAALETSTELKLNENKTRIKRITEVHQKSTTLTDKCTIYTEFLPPNSDHDTLRDLFSKCGKVTYVSLPRHPDKTIKGFAFIEFATHEEAKNALHLNEYDFDKNPKGLRVMLKTRWIELRKEYEAMLAEDDMAVDKPSKPKRSHERKDYKERPQQPKKIEFQANVVVRIDGVKEGMKAKDVKDAILQHLKVAYVDYVEGTSQVFARSKSPDQAKELIASADKFKPALGDITVTLLQNEEETRYWERVEKQWSKRYQKQPVSTPGFYEQKPSQRKTQYARNAPARTHVVFNEAEPMDAEQSPSNAPPKPEAKHTKFDDE